MAKAKEEKKINRKTNQENGILNAGGIWSPNDTAARIRTPWNDWVRKQGGRWEIMVYQMRQMGPELVLCGCLPACAHRSRFANIAKLSAVSMRAREWVCAAFCHSPCFHVLPCPDPIGYHVTHRHIKSRAKECASAADFHRNDNCTKIPTTTTVIFSLYSQEQKILYAETWNIERGTRQKRLQI